MSIQNLMTAAPDLYTALNNLVKAANILPLSELAKQNELWDEAEKALCKAEGRGSIAADRN